MTTRRDIYFVEPKFLKISESNQIFFIADESCLSSQSNLQFLEFGNIFFRRNTKSDFEFKYKADTIDASK